MKVRDIVKDLLNGKTYDDFEDLDNPIQNGFNMETLFKILVIDKNITSIPINYNKIYNCQMNDVLTSNPITNIKDVYNDTTNSKSGGKSDLTIKSDDGYMFCSSKITKFKPGNSDVERIIKSAVKKLKLKEEQYKLIFVCPDKNIVLNHRHQHPELDDDFNNIINNNLLFDVNDIRKGIEEFHKLHNNKTYNEYCDYINNVCLNNNRKILKVKLHQQMTLNKFINNYNKGEKKHLISHKTRTGKSITQLLIIKWLLDNNKKVLFMTSVPSTILNFIKDLEEYITFKDITYYRLQANNEEELLIDINSLSLCSIQFLKNDANGNKKEFLKKQMYDVILIDECHYGSSTNKTKNNIIDVDKNIKDIRKRIPISIFSSGTSMRTQKFYKIKNSCIYEWNLYDESQMKLLHNDNYENNDIINNMILRHGNIFNDVIDDYCLNRDYTNMPTQMLMKATIPLSLENKIKHYNAKNDKNIGFSLKSLFALKSKMVINGNDVYQKIYEPKFELEDTNDGEDILEDYLDNIISNNKMKNTIMKNIEIAQSKHNSRKSTKENPKLFIIYLPTHTNNSSINILQNALINFIKKKNLWSKYNIVSANSKENMGDYKKEYNEEIICAMNDTKLQNKYGCILLLGDKGSTGITYEDCDVSIHLDDGHNLETQIQKRARPGTPAKDKTIFINVDMNIQRTFYTLSETIKQYQVGSKKDESYKDILIYLYKHNLFLWNDNEFNNGEMNPIQLDSYFQNLSENIINQIDYVEIMNQLCEEIDCDDDLKNYIDGSIITNEYTIVSNPELEGEQKDVPKGNITKIEIDKIKKEQQDKLNDDDIEGKEEINENIEDTINKTVELAKSKRGLPFLALVMRINNPKNIKSLLDTQSDLIKKILEPKISKINENYIYDIYKLVMSNIIDKHQDIVNQIVEIYNITPPNKLRDIIASHFIASEEEELEHAEIPTPPCLCDDILKPFPESFWKSIQKVGELCCGKGNFVLAIFDKFYEGLEEIYPDIYERCKIICTECLYFTDINPLDIFITSSILKCHIKSYCGEIDLDFKFNYEVCNTLETDIKELFNINGFNAIIGNPPYNSPGKKATGNTIWQLFTIKAIDDWLINEGYLAYVHPPGWRKPNTERGKFNGMYKKMAIDNQIIYLEMHNTNDGMKVFKKGTRYDFYLLQKKERTQCTEVKDENYIKSKIDLSKFEWLPNSNVNDIIKLLTDSADVTESENCPIIQSMSAYEPRKSHMSKNKSNIFKYPCVHSTPQKGVRYMYSNCNNRGHFGIPKVIFGDSGCDTAIIDLKGEYGMTQHSMGIEIKDLEEGENILKALKSEKFNKIKDSCLFSSYAIDWNIFKTFKRDWWKEYVTVENCPIIYNRSNYGSDKKYISKTESEEHKYKIIHTIPKSGIRYLYSNCCDKGHFGISKVIFGDNGLNDVVIDLNGEYGMSENSMAIQVDNLQEACNIKNALLSNKFNDIIKSMMFGNFRIDWRIFSSFKRDWWKEYINEEVSELINVNNNQPNNEENKTNDLNEEEQITENKLKKMTIKQLKKYIKDNELKIKISQNKPNLIKDILKNS